MGVLTTYRHYYLSFSSKTKLHKHLRDTGYYTEQYKVPPNDIEAVYIVQTSNDVQMVESNVSVVKSTSDIRGLGSGYVYRAWNYTHMKMKFAPEQDTHNVCLDLGCGMSLIDRKFLFNYLLDVVIQIMAAALKVRGFQTS